MVSEIAGYRIIRVLRQGNLGTFYTATPPGRLNLPRPQVILKVMDGAASEDEFRRFANELKIFASLKSPHLSSLYEAGNAGGALYYAMEAFPDGSLDQPSRELTLHEKAMAVAAAARGAHDLHEGGIVHRDIRPANVMLDGDVAKLADLGLAHIATPGQTFTGRGPIGTIEFMDPVLVRGDGGSRATDTWSLAVTLHWALTGKGVHGRIPTANVVDALRHVLGTPAAVDPTLPAPWQALLNRCLSPDLTERPASAAQLAGAIEELASNE